MLTTTRSVGFSLPAVALTAALAVILPEKYGAWYARVLEPGLLLINGLLAMWVAQMYRGPMRRAFSFIAVFLALYGMVTISPLVDRVADLLGGSFLWVLLGYQVAAYGFLMGASINILRVVDAKEIGGLGKLVVPIGGLAGLLIIVSAIPSVRDIAESSRQAALLYFLIRSFDAVVMVLLLPVIVLFVQNARASRQESFTFVVIVGGIISTLGLAYFYELAVRKPLAEIAVSEFQRGSVLDSLYLLGYLLLGVGLVAHRLHQEWSLKLLSRRLEP